MHFSRRSLLAAPVVLGSLRAQAQIHLTGAGGRGATSGGPTGFDPASLGTTIVLTNGNFNATAPTGSTQSAARGIAGNSSGKHYFEFQVITAVASELFFGVADKTTSGGSGMDGTGGFANEGMIRDDGFNIASGLTAQNTSGVGTLSNGAVIGVAVDFVNKNLWLASGNVYVGSGNPATNTNPRFNWTATYTLYPCCLIYAGTAGNIQLVTAGTTYAPPSGFSAW